MFVHISETTEILVIKGINVVVMPYNVYYIKFHFFIYNWPMHVSPALLHAVINST